MSARPCCVYAIRLEDALLEYINRYGLTDKARLAFALPCQLAAKNEKGIKDDPPNSPGRPKS
jgi:hypothetical protein